MKVVILALFALVPGTLKASLITVSGPLSSMSDAAAIIPAPATVFDNDFQVSAQRGFDEAQGVVTLINHAIDGWFIPAGTLVDSHMIYLDPSMEIGVVHLGVTWTFDGNVIGVMSDIFGFMEASSSFELGAPGTMYFGPGPGDAPFLGRGFESRDSYVILGNTLTVNMVAAAPGDWIRVVTAPIPEPDATLLLAGGILALAFLRKRGTKVSLN